MSALVEFVLARYDEAAEWAQEAIDLSHDLGVTREWRWVRFYGHADHPKIPSSSSYYRGAPSPDDVLADILAKRTVLNAPFLTKVQRDLIAQMLAQPFADHDDFRPEWLLV